MIDITHYQVSNIRPLRGEVLLELLDPPKASPLGIVFPENLPENPLSPKKPAVEALVRKIGPYDPKQPCEVGLGDRVFVSHYAGKNVTQYPRILRLVKAKDIAAVFV